MKLKTKNEKEYDKLKEKSRETLESINHNTKLYNSRAKRILTKDVGINTTYQNKYKDDNK